MTVYRLKVEYDINGEGERATTKMKNVFVGRVRVVCAARRHFWGEGLSLVGTYIVVLDTYD